MSEQPERTTPETGDAAAPVVPIGREPVSPNVDTSPTVDDGVQDVDQDPGFEVAESDDNDDDDDPEVHEVA